MLLPARQRRQLLAVLLALSLVYLYWPCRKAALFGGLADDGIVPANATLGFRRILVINRPARADRRAAMETAAAVSGLALTFVDGITTDGGGGGRRRPQDGAHGSWLAHLAALDRAAATENGHALVLEDDVDWDVRIRTQMAWVWAVAAAADVLWLGHCGADVPPAAAVAGGIVAVRPGDPTVPAVRYMRPHPLALPDAWPTHFPPQTRVMHTVGRDARCSLAYGISPVGVRKLQQINSDRDRDHDADAESPTAQQWDGALAVWCAEGRLGCYAVNPPLFAHWLPAAAQDGGGGGSDIAGVGGGFVRTAGRGSSAYIRWSVRLNVGVLGGREKEPWRSGWGERGESLKDQWPD